MKFGVSSSDWVGHADPAYLARILEAGFEGIELHIRVPADLHMLWIASERLRDTRLAVTIVSDVGACAALEDQLAGLIDACTVLDARILALPLGGEPDLATLETLRTSARYAERYGITLALSARVEPGTATFGTTSMVIRTIDAIGGANVGLLYNTYRAHIDETSISSALLAAGDRLKYVQIAENDGAAPGGGQVRWNETFAALDAIRYDGWYAVDVKDDVEANAQRGLEFLRRHRPRTATA